MAEIINLRRARKNRAKETRAAAAEANRLKFGQTSAERRKGEAEKALAASRLDGHKIDDQAPPVSDSDPGSGS